jgi:hypothetical protein
VLARASAKRPTPPSFVFGRSGGNILPFRVTIGKDGRVTSSGPVQATAAAASSPLRNGLAKLAKAEGFFAMATSLSCGATNPDAAARFITVKAFGKTRTVSARGSCTPAFEELYAVLSASVGVSS